MMFLPLVQARVEVVKPRFLLTETVFMRLCLDVIRRHQDAILTWYAV